MIIYVPGFTATPPQGGFPLPPHPPVGRDMKLNCSSHPPCALWVMFPPHPPCGLSAKRSTVDMKEETSSNLLNNDIKFSLYFTMVLLHVATRNRSMDRVGCKSRRCSFQPQVTCIHQGYQRPLRRGTSENPEFPKET